MTIRVSFFGNRQDNRPEHVDFESFADFAQSFDVHEVRDEKDGALLSPAEYRAGTNRGSRNVLRLHFAMLDLDHLPESIACDVLERLEALGVERWIYSTWSHGVGGEYALRIALALSRPVDAREWRDFWANLHALFPESDKACKDAARIYYCPSLSFEATTEPVNEYHAGEPLDVEEVLRPLSVVHEEAAPVLVEEETIEITPEVRAYALRQVKRYARKLRELPYPGPIYPDLNPAAFACGRFVPLILERAEVWGPLSNALRERCEIPDVVEKNEGILDRGIADGMASPWKPLPLYPLHDRGLAVKLSREHIGRVRFVPAWGKWLGWDGKRWGTEAGDAPVFEAVHRVSVTLVEESAYTNEGRSEQLRARAKALGGHGAARTLVKACETIEALHVSHLALDSDPMLLTVGNGTLDLRNGSLHESIPDHLLTRASPVPFDREARAPIFDRFLDEITQGDRELATFIQRAIGYSLTGSTSEHCLFFCYGDGANGKSTFLEAIGRVLGDVATTVPGDLLLAKRGEQHPTGVAALFGRRFVAASEVEEGRAWDEPLVKSLTGSDTISARRMREDFWTFTPTHKLWIAGNYRPTVRGMDGGIWRRLRLLPFTAHVPRPDRHLGAKLAREAPGILAWAVRGCLDWQSGGLGRSTAVEEATAAYREESNTVGEFLLEKWDVCGDTAARISRSILYQDYAAWAEKAGAVKMGARAFVERMRRTPGVGEGVTGGVREWTGIRPKSR